MKTASLVSLRIILSTFPLRIELTTRYTQERDNYYSLNGICVWCDQHHTQTNPPLVQAVGAGMDFTMPSQPFFALVGTIGAFLVPVPDCE
jgi:hypothetical protein